MGQSRTSLSTNRTIEPVMVLNDQEGAVETKVSKTNVTGCIIPNTINTK